LILCSLGGNTRDVTEKQMEGSLPVLRTFKAVGKNLQLVVLNIALAYPPWLFLFDCSNLEAWQH
jgi:hypothetical protein